MTLKSTYAQSRAGEKSQWFTILESQSLAADLRSDTYDSPFALGLMIEVVVTGASTPSFTPKLETVDDEGNAIAVWSAAVAVTGNGTVTYVFFPGGAPDLDGITEAADTPLMRQWRLFLDHASGSATVEAHACLL